MARVTFNGVDVEVEAGSNLIDAAEAAGHEIPHYCYHPGLSVAGNCRMCLVEIKALSDKQDKPLPKLQIACNTVVQDGMIAESVNDRVAEAGRRFLSRHPRRLQVRIPVTSLVPASKIISTASEARMSPEIRTSRLEPALPNIR